jgi:hypothetical protein
MGDRLAFDRGGRKGTSAGPGRTIRGPDLLGFGGILLPEEDRQDDQAGERQKLAPIVLERLEPGVRSAEEDKDRDRRTAMLALLLVVTAGFGGESEGAPRKDGAPSPVPEPTPVQSVADQAGAVAGADLLRRAPYASRPS